MIGFNSAAMSTCLSFSLIATHCSGLGINDDDVIIDKLQLQTTLKSPNDNALTHPFTSPHNMNSPDRVKHDVVMIVPESTDFNNAPVKLYSCTL